MYHRLLHHTYNDIETGQQHQTLQSRGKGAYHGIYFYSSIRKGTFFDTAFIRSLTIETSNENACFMQYTLHQRKTNRDGLIN